MDSNSISNGSLYESTSSFERDNDVDEFFIAHIIWVWGNISMQDTSKDINVKWCIICKRYDKWSSLNMLWTISMDKETFLNLLWSS